MDAEWDARGSRDHAAAGCPVPGHTAPGGPAAPGNGDQGADRDPPPGSPPVRRLRASGSGHYSLRSRPSSRRMPQILDAPEPVNGSLSSERRGPTQPWRCSPGRLEGAAPGLEVRRPLVDRLLRVHSGPVVGARLTHGPPGLALPFLTRL